MNDNTVIDWLLGGDVSIQYQVYRDLLNQERPVLKEKIEHEGWGARLLALRGETGHWGSGFYQPKWTSSHYTLLELRNLEISNHQKMARATVRKILQDESAKDGGINPSRSIPVSDVCVNGMFLNYAAWFRTDEKDLTSVVDFILSQQLPDGGFNCHFNRKGATHSSLHSTLSVIEGIREYAQQDYIYRLNELKEAEKESQEFILNHKLFRSHRTGEIISGKFLLLSYPCRWRYDILRALDYFRYAGTGFDNRMADALEVITKKRRFDGKWHLQAKHAGAVHFDMEKCGEPSRWNTFRALRVLIHFGMIDKIN